MPPSKNGPMEATRSTPTIFSHVSQIDGVIKVPEFDGGEGGTEEVLESAFLTVLSSELLGNGETPVMTFQGQSASISRSLTDSYSVYNTVAIHCYDKIKRSRHLIENVRKCLCSTNDELLDAAFQQGGTGMNNIQTDISLLFAGLRSQYEKRKAPREPERLALYADTAFLTAMTDGMAGDASTYDDDTWTRVRDILEHHRAVARMQCKMYAEVLMDNTVHIDGVISTDEAIGVRYSFWLIANTNDIHNGNCTLLSFDHGVEAMVTSNRKRRQLEQKQLIDKQNNGKRGRDDEVEITRSPSENKFCLYNDILRNTYPNIYGVASRHSMDMAGGEFRAEFVSAAGHSQIDQVVSVYKKVVEVSNKKLEFYEKHGDNDIAVVERTVSCRFMDHYSAMLAIMKKHRSMQIEQQDPLSYMRSEGHNGIDYILNEMVLVARTLTDPMYGVCISQSGIRLPTALRSQILDKLCASDAQKEMIPFDEEEIEIILNNLHVVNNRLYEQVRLLVDKIPWMPEACDGSANKWYCPNGIADGVCFKTFLRKLNADGVSQSIVHVKHIAELREQLLCMNHQQERIQVDRIRAELAISEGDRNSNYAPCGILKSIVIQHPKFEQLGQGLHCDTKTMPIKILSNCFFEIHISQTFPNLDLRFIDAERREYFLRPFRQFVRSVSKAQTQTNMFAGDACISGGMFKSIHGQLQEANVSLMRQSDTVYTEDVSRDVELHVITDLTKSSPLYLWGVDCDKEYSSWKSRFLSEGIEGYADSFSDMLMNFADLLFNEVYTRDDMCARCCALREGAVNIGIFGSVSSGTLRRVQLVDSYDVTMESSVNAKQILMHVYGTGYRQGFTHRASLQFTMVVLTSGDPTIGEGTARRQPVHGNILGSKGLGKSMIEDMLLDLFFTGYVKRKGRATAAAHRTLSKKESLHCGADLMDEGNTDDRVNKKSGQNSETGTDAAENKKERMSSGEIRSTMAYPVQLPSGQSAIATHEMITLCRAVSIWARNDREDQLLGPLADRAVNWQLKKVNTDINPDEFAADEPVYNSDEHAYQERVRCNGRLLVGQTLTLMNIFGALSGFAKCIPGVDVSTISFMRSSIARVLERNGQPRFPPRMTNKVAEMMKVSSMLGVALQVFWDPWGLFSEKAIKLMGGGRSEFGVKDLLRDPQLPIVGMMYCDFQDALSAYVQLLNQDRIDEVNAVRDAFVELIQSARFEFWDLFGEKYKSVNGQATCDFNVIKIPVDQNAKTDRQNMWCLANKLKKGNASVTGGGPLESYTTEQVIEILTFIMDDERHAYQRHPDTLDVLMADPPNADNSMSCENASFTFKNLTEYNRILRILNESGGFENSVFKDEKFLITKEKINAIGHQWRAHGYSVADDSHGRMYFPNAYSPEHDTEHLTCDYICEDMVDVKTLCISTATVHGYITISTNWIFEGMRRKQKTDLSDVSLQQQIIEEVAHSGTNSGFYATQGIGMSNIKSGAPRCQDIFYVKYNSKDCTIQNTNYVSNHNHRMYGDSTGELPRGMQSASKRLEPLVPDSLQDGMRAWVTLMRAAPTVMINEHFMVHCDKRSLLIISPYILQQAETVFTRWCSQGKEVTHLFKTRDGRIETESLQYNEQALRGAKEAARSTDRLLVVARKHMEEVILWMMDTHPSESEFGYRHICRHYLHAENIVGDCLTGRDMHTSSYKTQLFKRFKCWICAKMIALYEARGEGQLVFNAMNKTTSTVIRETREKHHRDFNRELQKKHGDGYTHMTIAEITKLPDRNGELSASYNFAQSRLRLNIIAATKEIELTNRNNNALRMQISKEVGADAHKHKSYMESRSKRNDRPGAHSGLEYLAFIREKADEFHKQRQEQWPEVIKEYS